MSDTKTSWQDRLSTDPEAEVGEFKGNPTITLKIPSRQAGQFEPFTFGTKKATTILNNIPAIQKFVDDYTNR